MADKWIEPFKMNMVCFDKHAKEFVRISNGMCTLDHSSPEAFKAAHNGGGCIFEPSEAVALRVVSVSKQRYGRGDDVSRGAPCGPATGERGRDAEHGEREAHALHRESVMRKNVTRNLMRVKTSSEEARDRCINAPKVTRYVVTHIGKDGMRTLAHAMQGRCTYETPEQAQAWIDAAMKNNSMATLKSVFGFPLEVRPCECYAGHFDPVGIYFD